MASSRRGGTSRVLQKLCKRVEDGEYYEAHQMYRTLYFRYMNQNKHAEAIQLIYSGALTLLQHNQYGSGADLSLLLVQVFESSKAPASKDNIGSSVFPKVRSLWYLFSENFYIVPNKVAELYRMMLAEMPERLTFKASAIKWCQKDDKPNGCPELHKQLGKVLWEEKNFPEARYHLVRSDDGESCGAMLIEYQTTCGYASEVDMFVAQTVLQILCLKNQETASVTFHVYTGRHPAIHSGPPYVLPLLNFLWLLLLAVEMRKVTIFTVLCEVYMPTIGRDPSYNKYLDRIGQLFFGLAPPEPSPPQGLFGNLMRSLIGMGGGDDAERDDDGFDEILSVKAVEELD